MFSIDTFKSEISKKLLAVPTSRNGYHVVLPNGYRVSVQWGAGSYSDNRDLILRKDSERWGKQFLKSNTAEVAIINPDGELIETPFSEGDTVIGWQYPNDVIKIIQWAKKCPHDKKCPWCGFPNEPKARECAKCGGPQREYRE